VDHQLFRSRSGHSALRIVRRRHDQAGPPGTAVSPAGARRLPSRRAAATRIVLPAWSVPADSRAECGRPSDPASTSALAAAPIRRGWPTPASAALCRARRGPRGEQDVLSGRTRSAPTTATATPRHPNSTVRYRCLQPCQLRPAPAPRPPSLTGSAIPERHPAWSTDYANLTAPGSARRILRRPVPNRKSARKRLHHAHSGASSFVVGVIVAANGLLLPPVRPWDPVVMVGVRIVRLPGSCVLQSPVNTVAVIKAKSVRGTSRSPRSRMSA